MRLRLALALILLSTCLAHAQAAIPVEEEPYHHPVFSNDYVRILNVSIPAHKISMMHQHDYDYVFVMLRDGDMTSTRADGYSVTLQLTKGEARLTKGGFAHRATNNGDTALRIMAVELLKGAGQGICGGDLPRCEKLESEVPTHEVIVETDRIRVSSVHMEPGVGDMHRHEYPHLAIALNPTALRNEVAGKAPEVVRYKTGEYKWLPGGFTHTLTNAGRNPTDFVVIEFKDAGTPPTNSPDAAPETPASPDESSSPTSTDEDPE